VTRRQWFIVAMIVAATFVAYRDALSAPFFFNDSSVVLENRSIRDLRALGAVLSPAAGESGIMVRPVVNLSLALNYVFGGTSPAGYHAVNIVLHMLSALLLLGAVRRTLLAPAWGVHFAASSDLLAGAVALIWALHPLQTESVVCVAQRAELLGGLFYFLTLYCYVRGTVAKAPSSWNALAIGACALGMASNEVMVTAPVILLLHDVTFVAADWREAWRRRCGLYVGVAMTWLVFAWLVARSGGSSVSGELGRGIAWWADALTQCDAVVRHLWLSVWPHPLVVDYGTDVTTHPAEVRWQIAVLVVLLTATAMTLRRRLAIGFLGAWFFLILAPRFSVVPLAGQTMAEHRVYLPLAAVIAVIVGADIG
jgi:protein O-mannosyl-transferase